MMFVATVVTLVLLATFFLLAYRGSMPALVSNQQDTRTTDPLDGAIAVARRRLRQGEITHAEYERIITILRD